MKELKTVKKHSFQLVNKLTLEMDKFRKPECRHFETYVFDEPIGKFWFIRYPGATRGKIVVDENMIIQKISLYNDTRDIYEDSVDKIFEKYIGMKLIIKK